MKKLLLLSTIGILSLSSFKKLENVKTKPVAMTYWRVTCGGVASGGFWCEGCTHESAMVIAQRICAAQ